MTTKICTKCKIEKSIEEFNKNSRIRDGKNHHCKQCTRMYMSQKTPLYKDNQKKYYEENKNQISERKKERYQKDKDTIKAQVRQYAQNNKEKILERNRNYRNRNKEMVASKQKDYHSKRYAHKKEEILAKNKIYAEKNKDKFIAYNKAYQKTYKMRQWHKEYRQTSKYKAIRRNADHSRRISKKNGDVTTYQMMILQENATHCYWCKTSLKNKKLHVDHYMPISKGGEHTISNLVATCSHCNLTKNAKLPEVFAHSIGRLL